jgi:hypothetical protein
MLYTSSSEHGKYSSSLILDYYHNLYRPTTYAILLIFWNRTKFAIFNFWIKTKLKSKIKSQIFFLSLFHVNIMLNQRGKWIVARLRPDRLQTFLVYFFCNIMDHWFIIVISRQKCSLILVTFKSYSQIRITIIIVIHEWWHRFNFNLIPIGYSS